MGENMNQGLCKYRPTFFSRPSSPVTVPIRALSRCGKCFQNKPAPQDFTSGWCNDCRKKLVGALASAEAKMNEMKGSLTRRTEAAEAKMVYLKKFHMSPLNPAFKGDVNFYIVGSTHLNCKLCEHRLEGFDPPIQAHRFILVLFAHRLSLIVYLFFSSQKIHLYIHLCCTSSCEPVPNDGKDRSNCPER